MKEWNENSSAHPVELLSSSIGWGAGLQSSRLVQGKGFESAQGLNKGNIK